MRNPIVIIGIGEMASVFARGFLRSGYPVYPITRSMNIASEATNLPLPEHVLIAVAEGDLHTTLEQIPLPWRDRLILLQNELLPCDWQRHELTKVTVISVWFEKKRGHDAKVIIPSPLYGPAAAALHEALGSIDIPCKILADEEALLFELVAKNLYILTTNIAGLMVGGTVSTLWQEHEAVCREVAAEIGAIQAELCGQPLPLEPLIDAMVTAFLGDPEHQCMGRSAPTRLRRALEQADKAGLKTAKLREIAANCC